MNKIFKIILTLLMVIMLVPIQNISAEENNNYVVSEENTLYLFDGDGTLLGTVESVVEEIRVVYDGAWFGMRAVEIPRIINVTVTCRGTGIFANSAYDCTLYVALEFKYNSETNLITSVGTPDVYRYVAPGAPTNASNPRATASIGATRRAIIINGFIDYTAVYSQTFTGSRTYRM